MSSIRRNPLRLALAAAGLLTLGVVTTVAVAWGCAKGADPASLNQAEDVCVWAERGPTQACACRWAPPDRLGSSRQVVIKLLDPEEVLEVQATRVKVKRGCFEDEEPSHPRSDAFPFPSERAFEAAQKAGFAMVLMAGWPQPCLGMTHFTSFQQASTVGALRIGKHELPFDPMWPGLAANTAFYATAWFLIFLAQRQARHALRRRRGACTECGYDLAGLEARSKCPECGT